MRPPCPHCVAKSDEIDDLRYLVRDLRRTIYDTDMRRIRGLTRGQSLILHMLAMSKSGCVALTSAHRALQDCSRSDRETDIKIVCVTLSQARRRLRHHYGLHLTITPIRSWGYEIGAHSAVALRELFRTSFESEHSPEPETAGQSTGDAGRDDRSRLLPASSALLPSA